MNHNADLLHRFFSNLNQHDHQAMANCYHPDAAFHDIAFDLRGENQIHSMWQMICGGDIRVAFEVVQASEQEGVVRLVDEYTFSETGRRVRNPIESRFRFRDGLIIEQRDSCDPRAWAAMAVGGLTGFLAGRFRFLRSWKARSMLRRFINETESARARRQTQ
jgi:ketosteroid isomerase-like protein